MKIIGIGNALVDLMTQIDNDNILEELGLPKGSMQLVDSETSAKAISATSHFPRTIASGGSAANTIHGLARLGMQTGFIGKTGRDPMGNLFEQDLRNSGIHPMLFNSETTSGVALALVSPDGERTFATYLGAAVEMTADDITPELFSGYDLLHIEGYLLQNYGLISEAIKTAKELGLLVSLDLASYNVVEQHREFLNDIIDSYIDIVFANEEESKALTGLEPVESVKLLGQRVDVAIVKTGPGGSNIVMNGTFYHVPTDPIQPVDTTGAGDLYAAGFLFGLSQDLPATECGKKGTILASEVIKHVGAKIPENKWDAFRQL